MTAVDAALVRRKLSLISRNLSDLASIAELSLDEYRSDRFRQKATERLLQEIVEAAVDANLHVVRALGAPTPPDYFDSFIQLGRQGVIPEELAQRLAPSAGLRNRLVHEYEEIDDQMVLNAVTEARRDFADYVAAAERFLTERGF